MSDGLTSKQEALGSWASLRCWAALLASFPRQWTLLSSQRPAAAALLPPVRPSLQGGRGVWFWGHSQPVHSNTAVMQPKVWGVGGRDGAVSMSSLLLFLWVGEGLAAQPVPTGTVFFFCANQCLEPLPPRRGAW